jgi:geranylgeranyl reductase family protein
MNKYDAIVIGAGPGGSTAAYHLAKAGVRTLLLEKAKLPRFKACGGGISALLAETLPVDISSSIRATTNFIQFTYYGNADPVQVQLNCPLYLVNRPDFDDQLAQAAANSGAQLLEECSVSDVRKSLAEYAVQTDKGYFYADYVIAADGVHSAISRKLGFPKPRTIFALEAELPDFPANLGKTYWGLAPVNRGFAWVFPKSDLASVGILGEDTGRRLKEELKKWIDFWGYKGDIGQLHGHPIPLIDFSRPVQSGNFLTIGDAAGLADPLTGEGIKFAILSARLAAAAIIDKDPNDYSAKVLKQIYPKLVFSRLFKEYVYAFPKIAYLMGVKNPIVQQMIIRIFDSI